MIFVCRFLKFAKPQIPQMICESLSFPFIWFCVATIGVCVFSALTSVGALFIFIGKEELDMGNEIKRDMCPEKYYAQGSVLKESVPTIVALIIVAFASGKMFNKSGIDIAVTIVIEIAVVLMLYGAIFMLLKRNKARLAETYISVCENGVCGVCPLNGYKNKDFYLLYNEITDVAVKGEKLHIISAKGKVVLTLGDASGTAALIRNMSLRGCLM